MTSLMITTVQHHNGHRIERHKLSNGTYRYFIDGFKGEGFKSLKAARKEIDGQPKTVAN